MARSVPLPALVLLLTCAGFATAQSVTHQLPQHGLGLKLPKRFKRLPVEKDRHCVLMHWMSSRGFPIRGVRWTHRPTVRVVVLSRPAKPAEQQSAAEAATAQPVASRIPSPGRGESSLQYRDYPDYLRKNLSGRLTFLVPEKIQVAGRTGHRLVVHRREDRRTYYLEAWSVERGDRVYTVEFMLLSDHQKKLARDLKLCLKSFTLEEKEPEELPRPIREPLWRRDPARWRALAPEQRAQARQVFEEQLFRRVQRELPPGWRCEETDSCLLVTDSRSNYLRHAKTAAERCRTWLDDVFGLVSDERAMRPVVRVFDSRTDYRYYRLRSRDDSHYVAPVHEVVVRAVAQGKEPGDMADLHAGLLHHYLDQKANNLHRYMPRWADSGLRQYLRLCRVHGSSWALQQSEREKDVMRDARKQKRLLMPEAILKQQNGSYDEFDRGLRYQRGRFVRFLLHKNKGQKLMPGFLTSYARAVAKARGQFPLPPPILGRGDVARADREARDKELRKQRRGLRRAVHAQVASFDKKQWQRIDMAWRRYVPK